MFFDDFDDPDSTLIDGQAADIADGPWLVTEDLFADLDVVGGVTDTAGTARKAFGFFTAPLGPGQTLTLTVDTANTGGHVLLRRVGGCQPVC